MLKNYPYRDQDTGGGGGILPSDESLRNRLKEIQLAEDNLRLELETNKVYESRKDLKKQISSLSGQIQDLLVDEAFTVTLLKPILLTVNGLSCTIFKVVGETSTISNV